MRELLLGIDIGTSACKVAVFYPDGRVLVTRNGKFPLYHPELGYAEQNPDDWWEASSKCIREIFNETDIKPQEISAVGIDGQSWAAVAIDGAGKCLCNCPIWMDTRSQSICDELNARIGDENIFNVSGNPLKPGYTTAKILWYKQNLPEIYSQIDKILQCNGYIAFKLTGKVSQDLSQGYGWHCFNMRTGKWDYEMAKALGIEKALLPDIVPCDFVLGGVTNEAHEKTGLCVGTPVVAGGLDAACGTLGAGVINPGECQEQGGQAGGMSICLENYSADPRLILSFHVIPDKWLLQGGTTGGGGVLRWFTENFMTPYTPPDVFYKANELAESIKPGCEGLIFLPYMSGERTPIWDINAKGVFYGIDFSKTRAHFVRACMEGTAFALNHNLKTAESAGAFVNELRAMGGSANSFIWTQIKSDVTGKRIIVPSSDTATTMGAAMLAGVGAGIYKDYNDAVKQTVRITRSHEPDESLYEIYNTNYKIYLELYKNLKATMNKGGK